jgi:hypothetical protein
MKRKKGTHKPPLGVGDIVWDPRQTRWGIITRRWPDCLVNVRWLIGRGVDGKSWPFDPELLERVVFTFVGPMFVASLKERKKRRNA